MSDAAAALSVSVVIATHNRQALLDDALAALANQTWPHDRLEIIVADNGSTDATSAVVAAAAAHAASPPIKYLFVGAAGKSHAVNAALQLASGDVIALTDDDVRPDAKWIAALVGALDETGCDFVAGRVRPLWEVEPPRWLSPALYGVFAIPDNGDLRLPIARGEPSNVMPIGANMAVRTAILRRVGGLRTDLGKLDGTLRTGEDHELFLRLLDAGCRGVYEPTAIVHHWVTRDRLRRTYVRRWLHQNGRDVARVEREYPPQVARLLGVPRYLWRHAAADAATMARAAVIDAPATRFAAEARLLWFAGYLREAWSGPARANADRLRTAHT
jgi:glycosyltransferase involved in cell wall biosynthesis